MTRITATPMAILRIQLGGRRRRPSLDGSNTHLYTARADFPTCGDNACNGLESEASCTTDCAMCGNGFCGPTEDAASCAYDCGWCGDSICGAGEDGWSCSNDCSWCGDGICGAGEDSWSCINDCGWCGDGYCGGLEESLQLPLGLLSPIHPLEDNRRSTLI